MKGQAAIVLLLIPPLRFNGNSVWTELKHCERLGKIVAITFQKVDYKQRRNDVWANSGEAAIVFRSKDNLGPLAYTVKVCVRIKRLNS